jgi:putative ABC transport system ATP-binding protein
MSISTAPQSSILQTASGDLDTLALLIERLGNETKRRLFRSTVRDALERAAGDESASRQMGWQEWIIDSLESLGLHCRAIEGTIAQMLEMAADGAPIITCGDGGAWWVIAKMQRGRYFVLRPLDDEITAHRLSREQIRESLSFSATGDVASWVVIEPGSMVPSTQAVEWTPLQRLWALLKPEWPDIRMVIVFAMVIGLLTLAVPIAVETLVNTVAFGRFMQPIVILSLMLFAFLAFSGALRALQTYVVEIIQRRLFARVVADLAYRLPRIQVDKLEGHSARELVNRFFDIVIVQKVAAQLLLDGISLVLGTVIGMTILAFYHPWLLGYDIMLLAMLALIVFVLGRGAVQTSIKESKIKYHTAAWLEELAGCPTAFRYDGAARFAAERADHLMYEYLTARSKHFRIVMRQVIFALTIQAISSTVLLGLGGGLVISRQLTLGQLVAAELIVTVIVGSFAKMGKHMESFYDLMASVDKLGVLFDLPIERQDGLVRLPSGDDDRVEMQDVDYYQPNEDCVLHDFCLLIQPGDRIALTGPAGSGKSTLLDLLFGLRAPSRGNITVMGVGVSTLRPDALRRHVALVRDLEVFEGTVAENVRLGRPDVSVENIRNALASVGLLDDVLRLPRQLDTPLTSSGGLLTTTQLHRLMLARACAGSPRLLLIDGTLDRLPDQQAHDLLTWCRVRNSRGEFCWSPAASR